MLQTGEVLLQIIGAGAVTGVFDSVNGFAINPDKYLAVIYGPDSVKLVVALPGDANLDGVVGCDDLLALQGSFGPCSRGWLGGDFNMDGQLNYLDYLTLKSHYGESISGGGSIPEPATLSMMALASLALLVRRRRHTENRAN